MSPQFATVIGAILMAGCGSALGRHMGLVDLESILMAGFALGVVMLGQVPALTLRQRVVALEAQLARDTDKGA